MNLSRLTEYFPMELIEFRPGTSNHEGTKTQALAYIDARHVMNRLDEVVGMENWQNEFREWKDKSQVCGIGIFNHHTEEWVWKWDGADNTDFEGTKGGFTDAFKRAAVLWGIARYLYNIPSFWVAAEKDTKGKVKISNQEEPRKLLLKHLLTPLPGKPLIQDRMQELKTVLQTSGIVDVNRFIKTIYGPLYTLETMTDISGKNLSELSKLIKNEPLTPLLVENVRNTTKMGAIFNAAPTK